MIDADVRPATRPVVVIEPSGGTFNWRELLRFRDLFLILAERDVRLRYRQTLLGVVWVILQPLVASVIFAVVFGLFASLPSDGVLYILFVFAAMLPWNLFSGGVQRGGNSLINNVNLITKIYLPRVIIPIASVAATLLDFMVALAVMLVIMLALGTPITWTILTIPVLVMLTIVITISVSLFFSAVNVYYRDFSYALPFILQVWLFSSPLAYSSSLVPEGYRLIYGLNPMVGVIEGFRWALLGGSAPGVTLVESVVVACLLLAIGTTVFSRIERNFADVI